MESVSRNHKAIFRVLDSLEAPYGGWFLKLRFEAGDAPALRELKNAILNVSSPDGETSFEVRRSFALPPPLRLAKFPTAFEVRRISLNGSTPAGPAPLPFVVFLAS